MNLLALVSAVDVEIAIQGEDNAIGCKLGHANEARVGQGHRYVGVALNQVRDGGEVLVEIECQMGDATLEQLQNRLDSAVGSTGQVAGFGQDRFAGNEGWQYFVKGRLNPGMPLVAFINKGDQRTRIHNHAADHSPNPS